MQRVIDQRLDERAWARLASKSVNTLGAEETVRWTAKYYAKAGHEIKRLVLSDQEWSDIGRFADRTQMFFLSAKDFWYLKSSRQAPQRLGAAIIKAQGIQFRGGATIDLALKTETPPVEVFYWISPRS